MDASMHTVPVFQELATGQKRKAKLRMPSPLMWPDRFSLFWLQDLGKPQYTEAEQ
jgi:hypothetical protein